MRLSNLCILTSLVWLLAAAASSLALEAELAAPGLDVISPAALYWYGRIAGLHRAVAGVSLPLVFIVGAGFAMLAERDRAGPVAVAVAVAALVLSVAAPAIEILSWSRSAGPARMPGAETLAVVLAFCTAAALASALRAGVARPSALIYFATGVAAFLLAGALAFGPHADLPVLLDTYYASAAWHAAGAGLVLFGFAVLSRWMEPYGGRPWTATTLAHSAGLLLTGAGLAAAHAWLGLAGMPLGYADYPDAYADAHRLAALSGSAFVALAVLGVVRFARLGRAPREAPEDTFA